MLLSCGTFGILFLCENNYIYRFLDLHWCTFNVFYAITWLYYKNVQYLEEIMKRWVSEVHICALRYTFVPWANCALKSLADSWNAHPLSSEKNRSSEQLWILWINIQKGELCTYKVSFILIPQVKCFHFLDF